MMLTKEKIARWSANFGVLVTVIAGVYGAISFVDHRIDKKLNDDSTLQKISSMVRPACVFDHNGSVLYDSGAMSSIEDLEFSYAQKSEDRGFHGLPTTILVRPTRLLEEAPLLRPIDSYTIIIDVKRGNKFDWIYTLEYIAGTGREGDLSCRYMLEILP